MGKIDISGIIIPYNWGEDGNVIQIAIYTNKEDVYIVEHNRQERELLKHINSRVEVKGKKNERLDGKKYIGVQQYRIQEEIADEESDQLL